jgi:hypothetical protein
MEKKEAHGKRDDWRQAHRKGTSGKALGRRRVGVGNAPPVAKTRDFDDPLEATPASRYRREIGERRRARRACRRRRATARIDPRLACRIDDIADTNRAGRLARCGARELSMTSGGARGFPDLWEGRALFLTRKPPRRGLAPASRSAPFAKGFAPRALCEFAPFAPFEFASLSKSAPL